MTLVNPSLWTIQADSSLSVDDDDALRAKVNEALSVYDEYMKSKPPGAEATTNGAAGEEEGAKEDTGADSGQA